jgi:hypothetical protein
MRSGSFIIGSLGAIAVACATSSPAGHLGTWEAREGTSYVRVVLNRDGSCVFVAGAVMGDLRDGIGGRCRYSEADREISITDMAEFDGSGSFGKVLPPIILTYDTRTDSLSSSSKHMVTLSRAK